jgi:glycine dehydrogenase subunit 1
MSKIQGVKLTFQSPFFKEFVVNFTKTGKTVAAINKALLKHEIIGGKDLSKEFHELGQSALYCVTETKTMADIQKLVTALKEVV